MVLKTAVLETDAAPSLAPMAGATLLSLTLFCVGHFLVDLYAGALGALQLHTADRFRMNYTETGILAGFLSFSST
jgi:hypothetical protein